MNFGSSDQLQAAKTLSAETFESHSSQYGVLKILQIEDSVTVEESVGEETV